MRDAGESGTSIGPLTDGSFVDMLAQSGPSIGGVCSIPSTLTAEILALAGYDFVMIDTQHGLVEYAAMCGMILALERRGVRPIVRVPWNDPAEIMRALDAGAYGVVVPMIEGPEDTGRAAGACLYPPVGYRSWGPTRAALGNPVYTPERANAGVACIPIVETAAALSQIEAIVATPGVSAVYVGPTDLSLATTGTLADIGSKQSDLEAYATILDACREQGIPAGVGCSSADEARRRFDEGFRFATVGSDSWLLRQAAETSVNLTRNGPA